MTFLDQFYCKIEWSLLSKKIDEVHFTDRQFNFSSINPFEWPRPDSRNKSIPFTRFYDRNLGTLFDVQYVIAWVSWTHTRNLELHWMRWKSWSQSPRTLPRRYRSTCVTITGQQRECAGTVSVQRYAICMLISNLAIAIPTFLPAY